MRHFVLAAVLSATASGSFAAGDRDESVRDCNSEATKQSLAGDQRKQFMSRCLLGDGEAVLSRQSALRACDADARQRGLKGDSRKAYLAACVSK
jgi:hypothetical protein